MKKLRHRYNHPDVHREQAKLIGMPGYERSLKEEYLQKEKRIMYLDELFRRLSHD